MPVSLLLRHMCHPVPAKCKDRTAPTLERLQAYSTQASAGSESSAMSISWLSSRSVSLEGPRRSTATSPTAATSAPPKKQASTEEPPPRPMEEMEPSKRRESFEPSAGRAVYTEEGVHVAFAF